MEKGFLKYVFLLFMVTVDEGGGTYKTILFCKEKSTYNIPIKFENVTILRGNIQIHNQNQRFKNVGVGVGNFLNWRYIIIICIKM